MNNSSEHETQT